MSEGAEVTKPAVFITGASSGIGSVYAERFAKRGHDLILVARSLSRLNNLAARLRDETGVSVEVIEADLTNQINLETVEAYLRSNIRVGIFVNNAGMAPRGGFFEQEPADLGKILALNVTAATRLAFAAAQGLADRGGAIINLSSAAALAPELGMSVYGATKSFMLYLSQAMRSEIGNRGIYVQAVLPAATRTEIWERSGRDISQMTGVMDVYELVDAAMVGFDRGEAITIPSLPDVQQWENHEASRQTMIPNFRNSHAAKRYGLD